jgi:Zn-dependent protease
VQGLGTLQFHLSAGSAPPPQLIERLISAVQRLLQPSVKTQPLQPRQASQGKWRKFGPLGAALAFLAKFKTIGLLLATKGKLLLLALTNFKALISILGFLGIYWALYGWWFAVGIVGSIFLHEMGHYVTVRRLGMAANAPIFIPGFGAFVRWSGSNVSVAMLARIALAGPMFGFVAAIGAYSVYLATGAGVWLAVAHVGAFINLFNLIPISIFDGGSACSALGKQERLAILIVSLALWFFLSEFIFLFIALGAGYRLFRADYPEQPSQTAAYYFVGLLIALGLFDWWMLNAASTAFPGQHPFMNRPHQWAM